MERASVVRLIRRRLNFTLGRSPQAEALLNQSGAE
jgi:hypothetical protein